jgi:3-dehydroquinate synthase
MDNISLSLGGKNCHIYVGHDILGSAGNLISQNVPAQRFAIITNPTVKSLYGKHVAQTLEAAGFSCTTFEIPDSETSKSLDVATRLYQELANKGFDRDSCIIGLGGGAVGDLAGFVAATYMRGIELVHIPTTLLAQVDSAIGGKTGIDIPQGKNLVGAFHQPAMVISDTRALKTLPERDFRAGLAEVVKYGMISDAELFSQLEREIASILRLDERAVTRIVITCSTIKSRIVEEDERDRGKRLALNYGHTLGHALEAASGYTGYRHGEGVAIGMLFAASVSVKLGHLPEKDHRRLSALLSSFDLPTSIDKSMETKVLLGFMKTDKKSRGGKIRLVLPTRIGEAIVAEDICPELIMATLEEMRR